MVKPLIRRSPLDELINDLGLINPHVNLIHYLHRLTNDYWGHIISTFVVTKNSSQETYMENKYHYKGCQLNADINATRLIYPFIF